MFGTSLSVYIVSSFLWCSPSEIIGLSISWQVGVKSTYLQSDFYYDMEYSVEYSTFRTLISGECVNTDARGNFRSFHHWFWASLGFACSIFRARDLQNSIFWMQLYEFRWDTDNISMSNFVYRYQMVWLKAMILRHVIPSMFQLQLTLEQQ